MAAVDADALPERLNFREEKSFPWTTITTRMPVILTQVIDQVHKRIGATVQPGRQLELSADDAAEQQRAREGLGLLSKLKREMQTNKPLGDLDDADPGEDRDVWNAHIAAHRAVDGGVDGVLRWYEASWLLAECYMYRRIQGCLLRSELLASFDPFAQSKRGSYHKSTASITALADFTVAAAGHASAESQPEPGDRTAFDVMVQYALWGNKTDLSLRPTLNTDGLDAVNDLQVESTARLLEMRAMILCDHTDRLWATLVAGRGKAVRVDIVLDNAGFELFTDLCLAHWLTQRGFAGTIVFHTKCFPWFVSDTMDADVHWMLDELKDSAVASLAGLGEQFVAHLAAGRWQLKPHQFWTLPHEFGLVGVAAPGLKAEMDGAHLVLLKGDLNYRKLLADRHWPHDTDFGTVAGGFLDTSFCSLRTLKANLICGLDPAVATRMQAEHPSGDWLTNGSHGIIQGSFKAI